MAFINAEALGHLCGGFALVNEGDERLELVGRVHGHPDGVLGEAHFKAALVSHDLAWNGEVLGQLAFRLERAQRLQSAAHEFVYLQHPDVKHSEALLTSR